MADDIQSLDEIEAEQKKQKELFEERERRRKQKNIDDLKSVLSKAEGRRLIWRILEEARVFVSCYAPEGIPMANLEGKRDIGLFLLKDILYNIPGALDRMKNEHVSDLKSEKKELQNA